MNYHTPLQINTFYHIFSRAIGEEKLFRNEENYRYFLNQFKKYINPVADTYGYCLLPNHFHFLVKIKDDQDIITNLLNTTKQKLTPECTMQSFSNFLNSYTKSINKAFDRKGSLFIDYLRRVEITSNEQLRATLFYIHKNPVHHGLCKNINEWHWSSYQTYLSSLDTLLKREDAIEWFGDIAEFKNFHDQPVYLKNAVILE
ncbi:MAG: transposase [Sphingobacteriaceae bacterium]